MDVRVCLLKHTRERRERPARHDRGARHDGDGSSGLTRVRVVVRLSSRAPGRGRGCRSRRGAPCRSAARAGAARRGSSSGPATTRASRRRTRASPAASSAASRTVRAAAAAAFAVSFRFAARCRRVIFVPFDTGAHRRDCSYGSAHAPPFAARNSASSTFFHFPRTSRKPRHDTVQSAWPATMTRRGGGHVPPS